MNTPFISRAAVGEAIVLEAQRTRQAVPSMDDFETLAVDLICDALAKVGGAATTQQGHGVASKYRVAAIIQLNAAVAALKAANDQK